VLSSSGGVEVQTAVEILRDLIVSIVTIKLATGYQINEYEIFLN